MNGLKPGRAYIVKAMPIDDPAGQRELAGATNAGNGYQTGVPAPVQSSARRWASARSRTWM